MAELAVLHSPNFHLSPDLNIAQTPPFDDPFGHILASTTTISCTSVLRVLGTTFVESHTVLDMPIGAIYLSTRCGVRSISIGTILACLRQHIQPENEEPGLVVDIITGAASAQDVWVSTSRVPIFGNAIKEPSNCYRSLGLLSSVNVEFTLPPSPLAPIDRGELLAVQHEHHESRAFMSTWNPTGLSSANHFIVIFTKPAHSSQLQLSSNRTHPSSVGYQAPSPLFATGDNSPAHLSQLSSSSTHDHSDRTRPPSVGYQTPSPLSATGYSSPAGLVGFRDASKRLSGSNPPALIEPRGSIDYRVMLGCGEMVNGATVEGGLAAIDGGLATTPAAQSRSRSPLTPPNSNTPATTEGSLFHSGESGSQMANQFIMSESNNTLHHSIVDHVYTSNNISDKLATRAKYREEKTLLTKVTNHQAMVQVLIKLGYHEAIDSFSSNKILNLAHGGQITAGSAVNNFGWNVWSFKHKCEWFGWAEKVVKTKVWKGSPPVAGKSKEADLYDLWLGIQQFWGPGGPVALGHELPSPPPAHMEKAAQLRQDHIRTKKTALAHYLMDIPDA